MPGIRDQLTRHQRATKEENVMYPMADQVLAGRERELLQALDRLRHRIEAPWPKR